MGGTAARCRKPGRAAGHRAEGQAGLDATADVLTRGLPYTDAAARMLISRGTDRRERRTFNEAALDTGQPLHHLAEPLLAKVTEETGRLLAGAEANGQLGWEEFGAAFGRLVRRVVLGDAASDDSEVSELMTALRADANWGGLRAQDTAKRDRLLRRIGGYLDQSDPFSVLGAAATSADTRVDPASQVPHWLFAYDAAGIASIRTLALLSTHPAEYQRAVAEADDVDQAAPGTLPYLRACVQESLRLWPTTLVILRDSTETTYWSAGRLPAETSLLIVSSYFHRDGERLPYADRFTPEIWLDDDADEKAGLVPFSAGPATCPGRDLVLFTTSSLLATVLRTSRLRLRGARLDASRPLPRTLAHSILCFAVHPRAGSPGDV